MKILMGILIGAFSVIAIASHEIGSYIDDVMDWDWEERNDNVD